MDSSWNLTKGLAIAARVFRSLIVRTRGIKHNIEEENHEGLRQEVANTSRVEAVKRKSIVPDRGTQKKAKKENKTGRYSRFRQRDETTSLYRYRLALIDQAEERAELKGLDVKDVVQQIVDEGLNAEVISSFTAADESCSSGSSITDRLREVDDHEDNSSSGDTEELNSGGESEDSDSAYIVDHDREVGCSEGNNGSSDSCGSNNKFASDKYTNGASV